MGGTDAVTLGFLGGSFDPPHLGHLIIARDAIEQLGLERVFLIPAMQSPLRDGAHNAPFEQRLDMCRIMAKGRDWLDVLDIEGNLPAPSYTIHTARKLVEMFPGASLVWLLGADQWARLPKWKDYDLLGRMLRFGVAARPGHNIGALPPPSPEASLIHARNIEISSTELRERLYCKLPIDHLVPAGVQEYILKNGLYKYHQSTHDRSK